MQNAIELFIATLAVKHDMFFNAKNLIKIKKREHRPQLYFLSE